jgi:AbrB family looped-hinge helix DNA binding protein
MAYTSKVTERGQTTLPTKVRELLRAKTGDTLEYEPTSEGVLLKVKQPDLDDTLNKYQGKFGKAASKTKVEAIQEGRNKRGWDKDDEKLFDSWAKE